MRMVMPENVQYIVIKGRSGYVRSEREYSDTLLITRHSVEYECQPYKPIKTNPIQKWVYLTNSLAFPKLFDQVVAAINEVFERDPRCSHTDMPCYTFNVTFENGETIEKIYSVNPNEGLSECFAIIKKMIPPCELIPCVLRTDEDYEGIRLWHELMDCKNREMDESL